MLTVYYNSYSSVCGTGIICNRQGRSQHLGAFSRAALETDILVRSKIIKKGRLKLEKVDTVRPSLTIIYSWKGSNRCIRA